MPREGAGQVDEGRGKKHRFRGKDTGRGDGCTKAAEQELAWSILNPGWPVRAPVR